MKTQLFFLAIFFISCTSNKSKELTDSIVQKKEEIKGNKIISDSNNKLTNKVENLELEYTVWGCACPNWIQIKDNKNNDTSKSYLSLHLFIEPADKSLELPIYFDAARHFLKVKGQYYENEDYPQGTVELEEPLPKAKVFRYSELEVLNKPDFKPDSKIETLTLYYNAMSCPCAQWSETKHRNAVNEKVYYWLEAANEKLIQPDTLFNGIDLPLEIKVKGQIVCENGFPKRKVLSKVGQGDAGKVFRYTNIEIIKRGKKSNL